MAGREKELNWSDTATFAFDVVDAEFIVTSADGTDAAAYEPLTKLLRRMRKALNIDFVFIAEWAAGDPVVRRWNGESAGDELQAGYGMRLLEAASPGGATVAASAFHSAPVVTQDGMLHGTLCCRIAEKHEAVQATRAVRSVARLMADWFEDAGLSLSGLVPLQGQSVMGSLPMSLH